MATVTPARRFYSVAEADHLLPEVRRHLQLLREASLEIERLRPLLSGADGTIRPPAPDSPVDPEHFAAARQYRRCLDWFRERSIEVKDLARGLIDFPARFDEREVRLCWLEDEEAILYWHDLDSGFAGRRPIRPLLDPGGGGGDDEG